MLAFLVYGAIAAFAGVALLGHALVLQALFARGETTSRRPVRLPAASLRSRA